MLSEHLQPHLIRVGVTVDDWKEAVRVAGGLLIEAGACEPRYIEAMIEAVGQFGPYMVLAPGLALAHARPEDGVLEIGMSLVTLDPAVEFGSEANDPVKLVIAFGAVDKERHIGMLQELALFLDDEKRRERLSQAASVEEVLSMVRDVEAGSASK
jgi:PTS system ascorbate-specific IIA component